MWDVKKLRKAFEQNDDKAGATLLRKLPKWPRPKPGVSTAVMVPRRGKRPGGKRKPSSKGG